MSDAQNVTDIQPQAERRKRGPKWDGEYCRRGRERRAKAWAMHQDGHTYAEIARVLGYKSYASACAAVHYDEWRGVREWANKPRPSSDAA